MIFLTMNFGLFQSSGLVKCKKKSLPDKLSKKNVQKGSLIWLIVIIIIMSYELVSSEISEFHALSIGLL